MAQGRVQINNLNQSQGAFPAIERKSLHIGTAPANLNQIIAVNAETDLDEVYGAADSILKTNLKAAQLNGGQNWFAYAIAVTPDYVIEDIINKANDEDQSVELVFIYTPHTEKAQLTHLHDLAMRVLAKYGRQIAFCAALPANTGLTWSEYDAALNDIVDGVAANRVCVVPQLHGNDLGVLAGRLCNHNNSIADSPMRVASGALLGLGKTPKDKDGVVLPSALLTSLDSKRISCIQKYADYEGVYFGDANMLEVKGGDYQVIEYLRPVMAVARAVRILAIARIANRQFNSTPQSIEYHKTYFARPLREMSKGTVFNNIPFPADIKPPTDDAIHIVWKSKTSVEIYIKVCPYNSPKHITANILLDLSMGDE